MEARAQELSRQENTFWLERLLAGYQSRRFQGDVDKCHAGLEASRKAARAPAPAPDS